MQDEIHSFPNICQSLLVEFMALWDEKGPVYCRLSMSVRFPELVAQTEINFRNEAFKNENIRVHNALKWLLCFQSKDESKIAETPLTENKFEGNSDFENVLEFLSVIQDGKKGVSEDAKSMYYIYFSLFYQQFCKDRFYKHFVMFLYEKSYCHPNLVKPILIETFKHLKTIGYYCSCMNEPNSSIISPHLEEIQLCTQAQQPKNVPSSKPNSR